MVKTEWGDLKLRQLNSQVAAYYPEWKSLEGSSRSITQLTYFLKRTVWQLGGEWTGICFRSRECSLEATVVVQTHTKMRLGPPQWTVRSG